jgi:hypothetical protein
MKRSCTIGVAAGFLAIVGFLVPAAAAEPVVLDDGQLDGVAAGLGDSAFGDGSRLWRSTSITTHISMPMSTAIAVCYFCSDNASAVAIANAIGLGSADSRAVTLGQGNSFALSNSIGPFLIFAAPPPALSGGAAPSPK